MPYSQQITVTGGTGLLGSQLLYELSKTKETIVALKRQSSSTELVEKIFKWGCRIQDYRKIHWIDGDITDINCLLEIFKKGSQVYHVAGKVSLNAKEKQKMFEVNMNGTANVVNAALEKGIRKLCHVSSIAAIGHNDRPTLTDEEVPWIEEANPSIYGKSKYEAEREVWRGIAEGLNAVIVNPTIILGPGNWTESSAQLFHRIYKGLGFYTQGTNGYVDAEDLAKIMIQLMESKIESQRFIINAENITYKQMFTWIAEALGVKPPKHLAGPHLGALAWRVMKITRYLTGKTPLITKDAIQFANTMNRYSNEKIVAQTGYRFKPVKNTVKDTAEFFLRDINGGI